MSVNAEKAGYSVTVLSGDRDRLQLATDKVLIRIPKTKGGKTTVEDYYEKDVLETYKVTPHEFIDLKGLMGDNSDNIPGVPGIGEKGAANLLNEYGTLDGIYEHIEEVSKPAIRTSLQENKELAYFCKKLVTIVIDANLPFSPEEMVIGQE